MGINIVTAMASVALIAVGASGTRASDALPMPAQGGATGQAASQTCGVDIDRGGTAGVAQVTRAIDAAGNCVCVVLTGASDVNGDAENTVNAILRSRSCGEATGAVDLMTGEAAGAEAGGGGLGTILPIALGGVGATGALAAGLGNQSNG